MKFFEILAVDALAGAIYDKIGGLVTLPSVYYDRDGALKIWASDRTSQHLDNVARAPWWYAAEKARRLVMTEFWTGAHAAAEAAIEWSVSNSGPHDEDVESESDEWPSCWLFELLHAIRTGEWRPGDDFDIGVPPSVTETEARAIANYCQWQAYATRTSVARNSE